jgi:dTDP-4-dehydrorhamnose reductase
MLDLLIDGETGVRHLANEGEVSWAEFARTVAMAMDLDPELVRGSPATSFGWPARRPAYAALGTERGRLLPNLDHAVARYAARLKVTEFEAEADARAEGAPQTRPVRRSARVS